jgi:hypothetical protein
MHAWLLANPTQIKRNWNRFAANWLARQQDKGGSAPYMPNNRPENVIAY